MTHLTAPPGLRPRLCRDYLTAARVQQHVGDGRRVVCVSSSTGQPSPDADVIELCAGAEGIVTIAGTYFVSELKMRCRPSLPARSLPSTAAVGHLPLLSDVLTAHARAHTELATERHSPAAPMPLCRFASARMVRVLPFSAAARRGTAS